MGRRIGDNIISSQFADVSLHQQLNQANQTIEELTAEIERLRGLEDKKAFENKVVELRSSLLPQGIQKIPLSQIEFNPSQSRQTFSQESIRLLACSLLEHGQQQPILVFQKSFNSYLLFEGERRCRAARSIDWATIDGIIIPKKESVCLEKPETLRRYSILINHHRENLNPLDLAEALIKDISETYGIDAQEIPRLLNALMARLTRKKLVDELTNLTFLDKEQQEEKLKQLEAQDIIKESEGIIARFLLSLQLNPASIKANVFPALKFHEDLKIAIRTQGLGGHHAKVLQQISAEKLGLTDQEAQKIRSSIISEVIEQRLSVAATRQRVAQVISSVGESNKSQKQEPGAVMLETLEKIQVNEISPNNLKALETLLKQKLKEIKTILKPS
ncbi:ParB/RepB/Spo0J family partition protein [Gloeothece verrucosa]|uniref:ParB-like partition protein n=1 Tax=Gloeothece verrucosa (strain PCC 7822) TaxID=497965 RepID=E0UN31_GLOV7|nr:ParB/RepB/Spo0J family partition protein [Gloeothece verrucosa]ADN18361.1 parB-like partition protein [Gloeothece verrucosa PCC 7822]